MKAVGLKAKRLPSTRWFFIGLFCNLFPISPVGSDVIRGLGLAQETGHKPKVFASIVLDRLSGFAGIVILAAVAFFFGHAIVANRLVLIAIAVMSIVSLGIVILLFSHRIFSFACTAFAMWPKVKDNLMRLHYDIVLLKGRQTAGVGIYFYFHRGPDYFGDRVLSDGQRDASKHCFGLFYYFFAHCVCRDVLTVHRGLGFQGNRVGVFTFFGGSA